MSTADLIYIGLRVRIHSSDMTMPSKTQAALAAGRALVVAATGNMVRTAHESRAAFVADPGDAAGIADVLARACALGRTGLAEMGARGRAYFERNFAVQRRCGRSRGAAAPGGGGAGGCVTPNAMQDATVAITGGTGSFGSTMAGHLLDRGVARIHIFSRDEAKQDDMRKRFADSRLRFFLGDVRDYESVRRGTGRGGLRLPRRSAQAGALLRVLPRSRRCAPTCTAATTSSRRRRRPVCAAWSASAPTRRSTRSTPWACPRP